MSEHSATASAAEPMGLEKVERQGAEITLRGSISPAEFKAEIAWRKEMKDLLVAHVRDEMKEGHHFYYASKFGKDADTKPKEGEKPSLTKEGGFNMLHLLRCYPGVPDVERTRDGEHIDVTVKQPIFNAEGKLIATGVGTASTRESKYRYRWVYENQVPKNVDKATLQSRSGQGWKQFRVENPDIADLENTVVKMAIKRAMAGGVDQLPIVSEIFAPADVEPPADVSATPSPEAGATPPNQGGEQSRPPKGGTPSEVEDPEESAKVLIAVNDLLTAKCGDGETVDEDLATKFLKGRNPAVMPLPALVKLRDELAAM